MVPSDGVMRAASEEVEAGVFKREEVALLSCGGGGMSTVCDRFGGEKSGAEGGRRTRVKTRWMEKKTGRLRVVAEEKVGEKWQKNGVRGGGGEGELLHREGERERGGPLCGSLTDNGLIRPNVA